MERHNKQKMRQEPAVRNNDIWPDREQLPWVKKKKTHFASDISQVDQMLKGLLLIENTIWPSVFNSHSQAGDEEKLFKRGLKLQRSTMTPLSTVHQSLHLSKSFLLWIFKRDIVLDSTLYIDVEWSCANFHFFLWIHATVHLSIHSFWADTPHSQVIWQHRGRHSTTTLFSLVYITTLV